MSGEDLRSLGFASSQANDEGDTVTLTRANFVDNLGEFGAELFERLDREHRTDEEVVLLNVREARKEFTSARFPGKGKVVKPQRGATGAEEFLLMSLADVAEAFKAAVADYDWRSVFAPRPDLPAATAPIGLHRGASGRRVQL